MNITIRLSNRVRHSCLPVSDFRLVSTSIFSYIRNTIVSGLQDHDTVVTMAVAIQHDGCILFSALKT